VKSKKWSSTFPESQHNRHSIMAFYKDLPLSRLLAYAVQHKENYRFAGFLRNVTQKKSPDSISSE